MNAIGEADLSSGAVFRYSGQVCFATQDAQSLKPRERAKNSDILGRALRVVPCRLQGGEVLLRVSPRVQSFK